MIYRYARRGLDFTPLPPKLARDFWAKIPFRGRLYKIVENYFQNEHKIPSISFDSSTQTVILNDEIIDRLENYLKKSTDEIFPMLSVLYCPLYQGQLPHLISLIAYEHKINFIDSSHHPINW